MPATRIATGLWAKGQEAALIEAVHAALSSALQLPDWDRDIVLDLYHGNTRIVPTGRSDRFTRVEVMLFAGRSFEAKRAAYQAIVANLSTLGVPALEIKIILLDVPLQNWGIRGGQAASEVELGFRIDV